MIFTIAFDIKDVERTSLLLVRISELGGCIQYLSNSVFLQNSKMTATQIYEDLRKITKDEDRLLVVKIKKDEIMGWLSSTAVAWIREHN